VSTPSIKKNIVLSTAYQILTLITPFITAPYVSRVLEPDGIGVYSFTNSILSYFTMFAVLGTSSYGARQIARVRDDIDKLSKNFFEIELLSIVTSSICIALWLILTQVSEVKRIDLFNK
jgi:O-antigen/teichoic acid export membrane protein